MKNTLIFSAVIIFAGFAGYALQNYLADNQTIQPLQDANKNNITGQQRPEFAMLDLDGNLRNIKEWDGKVVLLNFWATWCPPCLKEIPDFIESDAGNRFRRARACSGVAVSMILSVQKLR